MTKVGSIHEGGPATYLQVIQVIQVLQVILVIQVLFSGSVAQVKKSCDNV